MPTAAIVKPRPARSTGAGKRRKRQKSVESPEFLYLTSHAKELEKYGGEILLISGSRLVAHSPNMADILRAIREHGISSPFIHYVPRDEEVNFFASV